MDLAVEILVRVFYWAIMGGLPALIIVPFFLWILKKEVEDLGGFTIFLILVVIGAILTEVVGI